MDKKYKITLTNILYLFLVLAIPFICVSGVSVIPAHLRFYAITASAVVCLMLAVFIRKKIILDSVTVLSLIFGGLIMLSVLYSLDPKLTLNFFVIYISCSMLFIADLPENIFDKIIFVIRVVCVVMAVSIVLSVFINDFILTYFSFIVNPNHKAEIITAIHNEINYSNAYSGLPTDRADDAVIMNVGIALIASKFFSGQKLSKHDIIQMILFVAALFFTNKRTLFLVPLIAFAVMILLGRVKNKFLKCTTVAVAGVCLFFVLSAFIPQLNNIYNRFFSSGSTDILNGRGELWDFSLDMYKRNPAFGCGFASFNKFAYDGGLLIKGKQWNYFGHNCYYEILGELGIVGTVTFAAAFALPLIYTIILIYRNSGTKHQSALLLMSLYIQIMCIVYCVSGNVLYTSQQIYLWYFAIAMMLCVKRSQGYKGIVQSIKYRFSDPNKEGYEKI